MKTRVRVKRAELIKVVDGRVSKAQRNYERAVAAYPKKVEAWEKQCKKRVADAMARMEKGNFDFQYGRIQLDSRPPRPSEARELCNLRRMLATLRMGAEETILLSQEDADMYFGECRS